MTSVRCLIPIMLITIAAGCGGDVRRASIHGTVSVNGKPLADGTIAFVPSGDNKGPAAGATIVNGSYKVLQENGPFVGTNQVKIISFKPSGRMIPDIRNPGGPMIEEVSQFIPARYNDQSTLERNVTKGKNEFHFTLNTEPDETR